MPAFSLLKSHLRRTIEQGQLNVIDAAGNLHEFGDGTGSPVTVKISDTSLYWKLALFPDPAAGDAFMDGTLKMIDGSIYDLFEIMGNQPGTDKSKNWNVIQIAQLKGLRPNRIGRARQNVAHHYELNRRLFELFLDEDMQYSCAYFRKPTDSLDQAQLAKKQHIAGKDSG